MATTRKRHLKSVPARLPDEGPSDFMQKIDPWFVGVAELFKEEVARRLDKTKSNQVASLTGNQEQPQAVKTRPPAVMPGWPRTMGELLALFSKWGDSRFKAAVGVMRQRMRADGLIVDLNEVLPNTISLLKYHATIPDLRRREMQGDQTAAKKIVETLDVYNRWMHNQLPRGGVRFKTNPHHNILMTCGLLGGLESLTSRELADFFDEFCPCGETHDPEVLRGLRRKLIRITAYGSDALD